MCLVAILCMWVTIETGKKWWPWTVSDFALLENSKWQSCRTHMNVKLSWRWNRKPERIILSETNQNYRLPKIPYRKGLETMVSHLIIEMRHSHWSHMVFSSSMYNCYELCCFHMHMHINSFSLLQDAQGLKISATAYKIREYALYYDWFRLLNKVCSYVLYVVLFE